MKTNTHVILKKDDLEKYCKVGDLNALDFICHKIKKGREADNKPLNNEYYICNKDEPYAAQVLQIIQNGELQKTKTKIRPVKHNTHLWEKNEDGTINTSAFYKNYCNGPFCLACEESFCVHCDPEWEDSKCEIGYFTCSNCNELIGEQDNFCKCCGSMMEKEEDSNECINQ